VKLSNIFLNNSVVTRENRQDLNGHKSAVIWFTGLSGSGKSTLAHLTEEKLHKVGYKTFVLDGDNIRHGISSDLLFNKKDRKENARRVGEVAKLMMEAGIVVIVSLISPFIKDRSFVRGLMQQGDFIEIYCDSDIEVCESRDVKGLYKRARNGKIKNLTGIDSPYEPPLSPEICINTAEKSIKNSIIEIIEYLDNENILNYKGVKK